MKKVLMSLLLVCLTLCLFVGCSDSPQVSNPEPIDERLYTMKEGAEWFSTLTSGTDIQKTSITDIVFCKETPSGTLEVNGVDLTKDETGKVMGYVEKVSDTDYKIYIVGDYIFGNEDCLQMFEDFTSLTDLNFGHFDTSKVIDMSEMFAGCYMLKSITFGENFKTSNVTSMGCMFQNCYMLESITFGENFNTSKVTNMSSMFNYCINLTNLNLNSFNTSNVENMSGMFTNCESLASITFGDNFKTSNVTSMITMFGGCTSLTSLDLSSFDTPKVDDMSYMFHNCSGLETLNLSSFVITGTPSFTDMFDSCGHTTEPKTRITIKKDYKTFFDNVLTNTDWSYTSSTDFGTYTKK